jgi:hypothetical protein
MTAFVGDILSATAAPVSAAPASSTTWSWLRNGATIPAATSTTYRVTVDDSGASIQALQSETNFLGSASTASNALTISPWTPSALFTTNEPGVWYDPSDLSTMFQDRAGTTPVTAPGQSVGLRLDKSQGLVLGPELVTNGTFDTDTTGWTGRSATLSASDGRLTVTSTASSGRATQNFLVTSGVFYEASVTVIGGTGTRMVRFGVSDGNAAYFNDIGKNTTYSFKFLATSSSFWISLYSGDVVGNTAIFDNISVKELPGNHAVAIADASRGTYGVEPFGGRRNLLTFTEQFENAAWVQSNVTVTANTAVAPDGTNTVDKLTENSFSAPHDIRRNFSATLGTAYTISFYAKAAERTEVMVGTFSNPIQAYKFNLATGSLIGVPPGWSAPTDRSILSVGNGWYRCSVTITATATTGLTLFAGPSVPGDDNFYPGDGTSGILIWGAQLEVGSTATNYQRVGTAFDVTEAGVPTVHYVQFDGADDGYVTPTITPNTDKAQVFAGVRKLSDAALGVIIESSISSAGNNGTLGLFASNGSGANYLIRSKGTIAADAPSPNNFAAPITNVLTGLGDISGDFSRLRINGAQVVQNVNDQGTGNFLAYPLYIGRRGGTTLPFNGRDYGLVVRFGTNLSTSEINRAEYYMAQRTGVTL